MSTFGSASRDIGCVCGVNCRDVDARTDARKGGNPLSALSLNTLPLPVRQVMCHCGAQMLAPAPWHDVTKFITIPTASYWKICKHGARNVHHEFQKLSSNDSAAHIEQWIQLQLVEQRDACETGNASFGNPPRSPPSPHTLLRTER